MRSRTAARAYALAVVSQAIAVALTRLSWPLMLRAPFALLFMAVYVTSRYGSRSAGLVATVLGAFGAFVASPTFGPAPFGYATVAVFVVVAVIAVHLISERNDAIAALRADIIARRQAEADLQASEDRLRRAQKMEAVGQLVAGVAHNFNNLLMITGGYAELLLDQPGFDGQDRHALDEIRRAAERGAALTRQMLAFSRARETRAVLVDLNLLVEGMRTLLTRAIRADTALSVAVAPAHATVLIDPDDFEQIILNLVINARDALPAGGHIGIEITRPRLDAADLRDQTMTPGEYVRVRIRDDGIGMSPDVQAHLFEPFFTTKEVGKGTGLGLAFVYGTVRQHHGLVTAESTPNVGTTFTLLFPLQAEAAAGLDVFAPAMRIGERGRSATILLVEDEEAVRAVAARTLRQAGHRVLEAEMPSAACALFDRHADEIDLLLTDVIMPEMHGPALAQRLVGLRPGLRVLLVSGHGDAVASTMGGGAALSVLSKPFAPGQLLEAVAGALAVSLS